MMRVAFRPAARLDAIEIATYLTESSPQAAERFLANLRESTHRLVEAPRSGRIWAEHRSIGEVRWIPVRGFPNHLVFYRVDQRVIEILRVLHGARREREIEP